MSIQAMAWAIEQRAVTESSARHVLLCLANYADKTGRGAFPSAGTLSEETGLSERTVRYKLDALEQAGVIRAGTQSIAAAYITRLDRRPMVYDLDMERGAAIAPRSERGAVVAPREDVTGCKSLPLGVQLTTERGAVVAPDPTPNRKATEEPNLSLVKTSRFADWWAAYPNKVARKKAEQTWNTRRLDSMADRLIADVLNRAANCDRWKSGYVPDPCTYINQDRWEDALRAAPTASTPTAAPSKALAAIQRIEGMKNGLADTRTDDRLPEVALLGHGSHAGD